MNEVKAAMYSAENRVPIIGFVAGLGGREVTVPATREMFEIAQKAAESGKIDNQIHWIGVRE